MHRLVELTTGPAACIFMMQATDLNTLLVAYPAKAFVVLREYILALDQIALMVGKVGNPITQANADLVWARHVIPACGKGEAHWDQLRRSHNGDVTLYDVLNIVHSISVEGANVPIVAPALIVLREGGLVLDIVASHSSFAHDGLHSHIVCNDIE